MYEVILENFSSFATLVLMIAEGFNFILFSGIALTFALLMARIARQKNSLFKRHRVPTLKKCPKCAEQLPISALLCDACDYNFLSRTVGHRHKLLPSPSDALAHEVSEQIRA
jgi:hypothetical protein